MKNLIIIGNGFDLAHGLKTRYSDFMADLNNNIRENPTEYMDLIHTAKDNHGNIRLVERNNSNLGGSHFQNKLIQLLRKKVNSTPLWSDLEYFYFQILLNYNEREYFKREFDADFKFTSAKELNDDFEQLKKYLEKYLSQEESNLKEIDTYHQFFKKFNRTDTTIVNFNYTKTVKKYLSESENIDLIQIHGELNNIVNSIIFGFAANDEESKLLLDKDDNDLLHNIKKINYKLTDNDLKLKTLMDDSESIDIFVMGHSCGISDKLILNQIMNHKKINSIRVFYYKDHVGYRDTAINLDRIIDDYSKKEDENKTYHKLLNFPQCCTMPQYNWDEEEKSNFLKYIEDVLEEQRIKFQSDHSVSVGVIGL